jgi:hypothetical protein
VTAASLRTGHQGRSASRPSEPTPRSPLAQQYERHVPAGLATNRLLPGDLHVSRQLLTALRRKRGACVYVDVEHLEPPSFAAAIRPACGHVRLTPWSSGPANMPMAFRLARTRGRGRPRRRRPRTGAQTGGRSWPTRPSPAHARDTRAVVANDNASTDGSIAARGVLPRPRGTEACWGLVAGWRLGFG